MTDEQQQPRPGKRRRGRRGRGPKPQGEGQQGSSAGAAQAGPPGPPGPPTGAVHTTPPVSPGPGRSQRRDTRGQPRQERSGGSGGGRTHRPPSADRDRAPSRGDGQSRREGGGSGYDRNRGGGERSRDRGPRVFEEIVPQDEVSLALGARFKEAQVAARDARKAMDKRKAEFDDEPEWMAQQLAEADAAFAEAATAWAEHLETTGRKVVRR